MKQFIYKAYSENNKDGPVNKLQRLEQKFEDLLNNPPKDYHVHSWQFQPETDRQWPTYMVVYELNPIALQPIFNGRKFKITEEM